MQRCSSGSPPPWSGCGEEGRRADDVDIHGAERHLQDTAEPLGRVVQVVEAPLLVGCSQERARRLRVVALEAEDRAAEEDRQ